MEVVGEVVLSVSLELLFSKLASLDLLKYARQEQVHTQLKKWEKKLMEIREVLDDAEDKQITMPSVRAWLADLRNLAYDVEDVLDEFNYQVIRTKLVAAAAADSASTSTRKSKVRKFIIPTCCSNLADPVLQVKRNVQLGQKIDEITRRLEQISGQKADLGLEKLKWGIEGGRERSAARQSPIIPPPPLAHESAVCGRDEDKKKILAMLTTHQQRGPSPNLSVVSIVAMGGMGKTTLAGLVYDDDETSEHFSVKAWVCVSDRFEVEAITRAILSYIAPDKKDLQAFHKIQLELRAQLKGQRFLIVLDDLWNEKYNEWDSLRSPLLDGAPGSKILVTTRNMKVANMMGGDESFYELKHLTDDDCWSVFQKHAFENRDVNEHPALASIGREIIKKCGGLPLAAKTLGGLLRCEERGREWEKVLNSKIWDLPSDKCGILPALRLSYNHLPSHLKRCFTYCAIFPKDYEFDKEELVLLWMAEGLIQSSNEDEEMEDLGGYYFTELFARSFFQLSNSNRSCFVMHDLINDLANSIATYTCLHLDDKLKNNLQSSISENTRHSSVTRHYYETFNKFERFRNKEHLRTFIVLPFHEFSHLRCEISNKVVQELIPRLRHLRVLSLTYYMITEIPDSLGELKHLRYLNLSHTGIKCLPESIGNLFYLQTLKLSQCEFLTKLPISIGTLINLRYLDVSGENLLKGLPSQISKLKDLRVLSNFIVGKKNDLNIKELGNMPHLRGELCISELENVSNVQDARKGSLKLKPNLESLVIRWGFNSDDCHPGFDELEKERNQMNVLDSLQPHLNLKNLIIQSYGGPIFPGWIKDMDFSKMVNLSLMNCRKCASLPCLGRLPSLKYLYIQGMDGVKAVGAEFYGPGIPFPSLESLRFADLLNWEDWSSSSTDSSFPRLRKLTIQDCPKLMKELPTYLTSLTELSICQCPKFDSLPLGLSSLNELQVHGCKDVVLKSGTDLTLVTKLKISRITGLIKLEEGFVRFLGELQYLKILNCQDMTSLWEDGFGLENLHCLTTTRDGHQLAALSLGCNRKSLEVSNCDKVERLPNGWQTLTCLKKLVISDCGNLVSLPTVGFPPMLTELTLRNCEALMCLPDEMMMIANRNDSNNGDNLCCGLEFLEISNCSSLTCFPEGRLPTSLKTLVILHCMELKSLPEGMSMCSLEYLFIGDCSSLISFPKGGELPTTLKELYIWRCEKLESLPQGIMQNMHHHSKINSTALQIVELIRCSSLTSFPKGKFPSTLKQLTISNCPQLESISGEMFHSTDHNSLESLTIDCHPNLKTLPDCLHNLTGIIITECQNLELFPDQFRNLTRLTSLKISGCENVKIPLSQWGLDTLPSLESLSIEGVDIFPNADEQHHWCSLPTTLTSLEIKNLKNIESLACLSLQSLTSLTALTIDCCPKLQSILPGEGVVPDTLQRVRITKCPLVEARCLKEKGQDWPKIAHIPYVEINGKSIFQQ